MILKALSLLLAGCLHAALAQPPAPTTPNLECLSPEHLGCGCQIRLSDQNCPDARFHLFTELDADAPLMIVVNGREKLLIHKQHIGAANKGDSPGRFSDIYANHELWIRIDYSPVASTCPKDKMDGCEYTDVRASILLQWSDGQTRRLEGHGYCGC